jgi:hypothetical protein
MRQINEKDPKENIQPYKRWFQHKLLLLNSQAEMDEDIQQVVPTLCF